MFYKFFFLLVLLFPFQNGYTGPWKQKNTLVTQWPFAAPAVIEKLMNPTLTHHSHYFKKDVLANAQTMNDEKRRIEKELRVHIPPKTKQNPEQRVSYFLIAPTEKWDFAKYLDRVIKSKDFDVRNCGWYNVKNNLKECVIRLRHPFKGRDLGLSFRLHPKTKKLETSRTPYLKIAFSPNRDLATVFPVMN